MQGYPRKHQRRSAIAVRSVPIANPNDLSAHGQHHLHSYSFRVKPLGAQSFGHGHSFGGKVNRLPMLLARHGGLWPEAKP